MRVLVAGIGNPWASDDGVGAEVIRRLQARLPAEPNMGGRAVEVLTMGQPSFDLLDVVDGYDQLIIVDAVASGAEPGTVHCVAWQPGVVLDRGVERVSSHGLGIREVLELGAALGRLPGRVDLWGIEAGSTTSGSGLSPSLAAAVPAIVERFMTELIAWTDGH